MIPYEEVRGMIIGGDYVGWRVYYDGSPQMFAKQYADTEALAIEEGTAYIQSLKDTCCGHPLYLYPDTTKWEIRIY